MIGTGVESTDRIRIHGYYIWSTKRRKRTEVLPSFCLLTKEVDIETTVFTTTLICGEYRQFDPLRSLLFSTRTMEVLDCPILLCLGIGLGFVMSHYLGMSTVCHYTFPPIQMDTTSPWSLLRYKHVPELQCGSIHVLVTD